MQAWERFVAIYIDLIKLLIHLSLEKDPKEYDALRQKARPHKYYCVQYSNPATDFRIRGIEVFWREIGSKYQEKMCGHISCYTCHFCLCKCELVPALAAQV